MFKPSLPAAIIIVVVFIAAMFVFWKIFPETSTLSPTATSTPTSTTAGTIPSNFSQNTTLAGGELSISYPVEYGLAISQEQILVGSYIPTCDPDFDYCLYYNDKRYESTNFESAGLRIKRRQDLAAERVCLETPPAGFSSDSAASATTSTNRYATSVFSEIGTAGAGHSASGSLYRVFVRSSSSCYEFETRIGMTAFANYEPGAVREFTEADRETLKSSLRSIIDTMKLAPDGMAVIFPQAPSRQ